MKKTEKIINGALFCLIMMFMLSCTEPITLDMPEGRKVPVVEGGITNEFKRHEIILSYSSDIYSQEKEMITDAEVYVVNNNDTIFFHEDLENPGHYLTDSIAGKKRHRYHLSVYVENNTLFNKPLRMYADATMPNNIKEEDFDSLGLLPWRDEDGIPFVDDNAAVCACPYFQTLSDTSIVYNVELFLNGKPFKNRPSQLFQLLPMSGYAGKYFNGPEMLNGKREVSVGIFNKSYLRNGSKIKVRLCSISKEYRYYLISQKLSVGANPLMGAYQSIVTNIFSNCDAVGWFSALSVAEKEAVYHE